jgi:hypothetical protein
MPLNLVEANAAELPGKTGLFPFISPVTLRAVSAASTAQCGLINSPFTRTLLSDCCARIETEIGAETHDRVAETLQLVQRQIVIGIAFGGAAVRQDDHGISVHVRIVGGE